MILITIYKLYRYDEKVLAKFINHYDTMILQFQQMPPCQLNFQEFFLL